MAFNFMLFGGFDSLTAFRGAVAIDHYWFGFALVFICFFSFLTHFSGIPHQRMWRIIEVKASSKMYFLMQ